MAESPHPDQEVAAVEDGSRRHVARILSVSAWVGAVLLSIITVEVFVATPRTSDAFVRANVIGVAPHVSGAIIELNVRDNQQVSEGDLLFIVDPRPYEAIAAEWRATLAVTDLEVEALRDAVRESHAVLEEAIAESSYASAHLERLEPLLSERFVTPDEVQQAQSQAIAAAGRVQAARAALDRAERLVGDDGQINMRRAKVEAALAKAELDVSYCVVRSPVDGYITNLNISRGAYANQGQQVFSIVDDSRWYVLANYREMLLERIEPGMEADVWLLACPGAPIRGVVEGVGRAIYQPVGANMDGLADVPPALDWVRLAQRFPVRIILDDAPECSMRSGSTATVRVRPESRRSP